MNSKLCYKLDSFHLGKKERAYFPKNTEDIRKFLIEHEIGRRKAKAKMFLRNLKDWKYDNIESREPVEGF